MHKERTRDALTQAAIRILTEEGFEALTAARIADEAEVSRRTFFNYFDRVEDVLSAPVEQLVEETLAVFLARPAEETLHDSVSGTLAVLLANPTLKLCTALGAARSVSPATRRFLLEVADSQTAALEEALWRRLGDDADPVYITGLAAATAAVFGRVSRLGSNHDEDEAKAMLKRGFDHLFAGFDPDRWEG